jgi:diguanylate cyclase (GGDEF)-like protein
MMQAVPTTTVYWLVVVSVLTSMVASYAAFSFAERVSTSEGKAHFVWLGSGALAMGLGIWSMHYLGMLSVRLPVEVVYHVPTVLLSLSFAVLASLVVLFLISRPRLDATQLLAGSVLMGSGIGAMHYTGMHAMRSSLMHHYRPGIVLVSIVVAVGFSWISMWIAFSMKSSGQRELVRLGGAALMGLGIAAMHYTAMGAVTFMPGNMAFSSENTILIGTVGVVAVAVTTAIVLLGTLLTAVLDRRMYLQFSEQSERLHAMAESSMDGIYLCEALHDRNGEIFDFRIAYVNSNVATTTAISRNDLIGGRMCELLPMVKTLGHLELYKEVVLTGRPLAIEFPVQNVNQQMVWIRIQAVKLRDGVAITAADITARKNDEERILRLAHHDPLTGLLNRTLLADRVSQAIERAKRNGGMVGIFLIDLDGFKQINDTLGHDAGDAVLVTVANRLQSVVRALDSVIRIGGDEFVLVMPDMNERRNVEVCADRVLEAFRSNITVGDESLNVHFSMGIAIYPASGSNSADLIAMADAAMYAAKRGGKNQYRIYEPAADAAQFETPSGEELEAGSNYDQHEAHPAPAH